jgi:hypothetical protein
MNNSPGSGCQLAEWLTVSLDSFHRALAALVSDPELVRRVRRGDDDWLKAFSLSQIEHGRVQAMAREGSIEVLCSLYRANRLTPLIRTVPTLVDKLGDRLEQTVDAFWTAAPRVDMQWRTEAIAFCDFVERRYHDEPDLVEASSAARDVVIDYYDGTH